MPMTYSRLRPRKPQSGGRSKAVRRHGRRALDRRRPAGCGIAGGPGRRAQARDFAAFCQPAMPSVQTSVSARDRAPGDQVAKLGLGIRTLLWPLDA